MRPDKLNRTAFTWRGLDLYLRSGQLHILTLERDRTYPHLYCIRYPDGWTSSLANLTRAKDAAYGHARYLLGAEKGTECGYSPFLATPVPYTAKPNGRLPHD